MIKVLQHNKAEAASILQYRGRTHKAPSPVGCLPSRLGAAFLINLRAI